VLNEVYLGLGSNLGDRRAHIAGALDSIGRLSTVLACSRLYETSPQGFAGQPPFLNTTCRLLTRLDPFTLMRHLRAVERAAGRQRAVPNGPRALDIDILLYGRTVLDIPGLQIPHPRMHRREFVLAPLNEIAPQVEHPVFRATVRALLARLPRAESAGVRALA